MFSACQSIPGLWYCPDLDGSFGTNVKFGNNLILGYHTLSATIHKFMLLHDHLTLQLCWFLIQYCNTTWSYFIAYFKWFNTENKHNLLHLKFTNKERENQTTRHMEWGVHEWCACLLVSLLYCCDFWYVCLSVQWPDISLSEGRSQILLIVIGKYGIWTILSLFLWQWLMTVDPSMSKW